MTTIGNIYKAIDQFAPFKLQEKWDNSGILVGEKNSAVTKVLLALDITENVVAEAINTGAELVISHHPVIFEPVYTLSNENLACKMFKNSIGAICAHTNLDIANGGVNDTLCDVLGLKPYKTFEELSRIPYKQVVVFVPVNYAEQVYEAMKSAGGGQQGEYCGCSFSSTGEGRFIPLNGANPFIGEEGKLEKVQEVRMEMLVSPEKIPFVIKAMKDTHPYEEPAYQILDNNAISETYGLGKVCTLTGDITAKEFVKNIKLKLGNSVVRYTGDPDKIIKEVAVCSGSGGKLLDLSLKIGVDAYITGDIKHDQWITARNSGITLIDAGHFHTENIIISKLKDILSKEFTDVVFEIANENVDPVNYEF